MGGKTVKTSQQTTVPPDVLARYNSVNAQAQQAAATPFQTYSGQFVAPLNDTQNAGIANTNAAAGQAQPAFQQGSALASGSYNGAQPYNQGATAYALAGGQAVDPTQIGASQINNFMSPYLQQVLGSTANVLNQNNQQQQSGALGSAIQSGAFGGDRAGIGAANLEEQQNLANANIYSNIENQGFNTALGAAQQQQGVNLSADQANRAALQQTSGALAGIGNQEFTQGQTAAQNIAGLGAGAQSAALQGAQAQLQAGGVQQQTQQAQDTALYNQFQQQQSYPFQTAQFLANIAEGTGALSGNTTSGTSPGSIFSDERLKEDIRPIGKTNDGQTIYSYRYKGDSHYQIGLLAQEVEKKHPDAVGLAGGYKTVNYKDATEDSERARRAAGGGLPYSGLSGGLDIPGGENAPHQMMQGHDLKQGDQQNGLIQAAGLAGAGKELGSDAMAANKFISGLGGAHVIKPPTGAVTPFSAPTATTAPSALADTSSLSMPEGLSATLAPDAAGAAGADAAGVAGADLLGSSSAAAAGAGAAADAAGATGADAIGDLAMLFLKRGGRAGRADGGPVDDDSDDSDDNSLDLISPLDHKPAAPPEPGLASGKPPATLKPTGLAPPASPADPGDIVSAIAKAEGTGKNPHSSARGAFQFTDPTFVSMFKKMFPGRANGMSDEAIVALRDTPEGDKLSEAMGPAFTQQNMQTLQAAGHAATPGNTYLAHFLGPHGALHILSSNINAPVESLLPKRVVDANASILKGKRVGDVLTWAANTVGKFLPREAHAAGGRAGYALDGFVDGVGPDDDNTGLAAGIDTFVPPDDGGSDVTTVAPVTVDGNGPQPTGLKPNPQSQVQGPPELLNRSLPNVQLAPEDEKPKAPNNPGLIDNITKFAHDTITGTGNAAMRAAQGLYDTKGTDDEYGVHHGPADWLIPVLTGIAGMGADRSGSLGGALAAGLGAGAGAYQGQREFGQKQQALNIQRMTPNAHIATLAQNAAARNVQLFDQAWTPNGDPKAPGTFVSKFGGTVVDGDTLGRMRAQYMDDQFGKARTAIGMAADPRTKPSDIAGVLSSLTPATAGINAPGGVASPAAPAAPAGAAAPPAVPATPAQPGTVQPAQAASPAAPAAHPAAHPAHAAAPGVGGDALATGKPVSAYTTAMTAGHSGGGEDPAALEAQAAGLINNKYSTDADKQRAEALRQRAAAIRSGANDPDQQANVANVAGLRQHYTEVTKGLNSAQANFSANSQVQEMLEDSIVRARSATNLNAKSSEISHLIGTLRSYLPNVPALSKVFEGLDRINGDQAIVDKDTARLNLLQGAASSLSAGAPAAALGQTTAANPDSRAPPEAAREAVVQMRAQRLQQKAFLQDWAQDGPKIAAANGNPEAYAADWRNNPKHDLKRYIKAADTQIPKFGGQSPGGVPAGAPKPVGTVGGQPVWRHPDGKLYRKPPPGQ